MKSDKPKRKEFVYVIGPRNGLYKIGRSFLPQHRALSFGPAGSVSVVFQAPGSSVLENMLHRAFLPERREGEWFELNEDHLCMIRLFCGGGKLRHEILSKRIEASYGKRIRSRRIAYSTTTHPCG